MNLESPQLASCGDSFVLRLIGIVKREGSRKLVYLNRIYTRGGDQGETSLGDGSRVSKTHARIVAFGGTDELNSVLGLARTVALPEPVDEWLGQIQNDLFDLGADLCVPEQPGNTGGLRVTAEQVEKLEHWIDQINDSLQPLTSFVLPGGSVGSAWLHLARTTCRRVEVSVWELMQHETINAEVAKYLNRLSDLLFVLGQYANDCGRTSVLWVPGKHRGS